MKRLIAIALVLALLFSAMPVNAIAATLERSRAAENIPDIANPSESQLETAFSTSFEIEPTTSFSNEEVLVEPMFFTTGTLSGRVTDSTGVGVAGIHVTVYDTTDNVLLADLVSGSDGSWSSSAVVVGHSYQIWYYHTDYTIENYVQYHTIGNTPVEAEPVTVAAGTEVPETAASDFTYSVLNGTYCQITGYTGTASAVRIPGEIDGYIVQSLEDNIFKNNTAIRTVIFPETVETMGSDVFYGCTALTDVRFNHGLTNVGYHAFGGCTALEEITFPATVTSVESYVFNNCSALTEVNMAEGLSYIGYSVFRNCDSLTGVHLPDSVTTMGRAVFSGCDSMTTVNFPANWTSVDGSYSPFEDCASLKTISIPEGVTAIPDSAFDNWTALEALNLPESLTVIGQHAFYSCTGLETINLPDGLRSIGYAAFMYCSGLRSVVVPAGITKLESYVFGNCSGLTEVSLPEGLNYIGYSTFQECDSLASLHLPDSITSMGRAVFSGCDRLTQVNFPASWTTVDGSYSPFEGCTSLKTLSIPEGVTAIPDNAFYNWAGLETLTLPDTLVTIGQHAFHSCTGLKTINLPDSLRSIGYAAFMYCSGLRSIAVPAGITKLESYVFGNCSGLTEVSLPDGLNYIGYSTFRDCDGLTAIHLPDSITTMGRGVFSGCDSLTTVNFPASWTTVDGGYSPFEDCTALKTISIPAGVTAIPDNAFYNWTGLETLTLPDTLVTIGQHAFQNCSGLKTLTLPDSLESIGYAAFSNCSGLQKIWIGEHVAQIGNYAFQNCTSLTIHGVEGSYAQEYAQTNSIPFSTDPLDTTEYGTLSGRVTDSTGVGMAGVHVTVYDITDNALLADLVSGSDGSWSSSAVIVGHRYQVWYYHTDYRIENHVQYHTISNTPVEAEPVTVTADVEVPETAASDFTYSVLNGTYCQITGYTGTASAVRIPGEIDGYIVQSLGGNIFKNNTAIRTVIFPETVETIGSDVFYGCTALTDVRFNHGLTNVGYHAFGGCTALEEITFPATVTSVESYVFNNCSALTGVNMAEGLSYIGYSVFQNCDSLTGIHLPDSVTTMGQAVFSGCDSMTTVNFPANWTSVDGSYSPFEDCASLKTISIPEGVTAIPDNAFYNWTALEALTLPDNLTAIGQHAFYRCTGLKTINLPDSLRSIGYAAFMYCSGLRSIVVPAGITKLESYVFGNCSGLTEVSLPEGMFYIGYSAFQECDSLTSLHLPDSITSMGRAVFSGCDSLTQVNFPASWTTVDGSYSPFEGCTSLKTLSIPEGVTAIPDNAFYNWAGLETLTLPDTLVTIGQHAFYSCTGLKTINLPDSLRSIGYAAFMYCSGLRSIAVPAGITKLESYVFGNCSGLTEVSLPEGLNYIGYSAFRECDGLTAIHLPDSITTMGRGVFSGCDSLMTVNFPANWTTVDGGYSPFEDCTALKTISIPEGVTAIPDNAFYNWTGLETLTLPDTLVTIGQHAFQSCSGLKMLTLPDSLESIGQSAFHGCSSLRSIAIPAGITTLEGYVFSGCSGLVSVDMGSGLQTIGHSAFSGCKGLIRLTVGESVTSIAANAFSNCSNLSSVLLPSGLISIGSNVFSGCSKLQQVIIPESVSDINRTAFSGADHLNICCSLVSHAAVHCIEYDIPMTPIESHENEELLTIDRSSTYYEIDGSGVSASGYLSMILRYGFKDSDSVSNATIRIKLPANAELDEGTLTIDGVLCTNYTFNDTNRELLIPVSSSGATVRFLMKPLSFTSVATSATITFTEGSRTKTNIIGTVYESLPLLSVFAKAQTAEADVEVTGVAVPNCTVTLSVDGVAQTSIRANKSGLYSATVNLGTLIDGKKYTISAVAASAGNELATAQTTVIYRSDAPTLTGFTLEYEGLKYDILGLARAGSRPTLTWTASQRPFIFKIWFDNPSGVESVYVVSTRNNVRKYIEGVWNEAQQCFIAQGHFDEENKTYVPGTISVEYTHKRGAVSFNSEIDFTSEEYTQKIPEEWDNAEVIVHENTDEKKDITIADEDDQNSIRITLIEKEIPEGLTEENAEDYGYTRVVDDNGYELYVKYYESIEDRSVHEEICDFSLNMARDYIIGELMLEGTPIFDVLSFVESLCDGMDSAKTYGQMMYDVKNSNLSDAEKREALEKLETANKINAVVTALEMSFAFVSVSAALLLPALGTAFPMVSLGILVGGMAVGSLLHLIKLGTMWNMEKMMFELWHGKFNWHIDPSGNVFDTVTGEMIAGATVTAYWIPYDEEDTTYWDTIPAADEYGVIWDASEYAQSNPLTTDNNGHYAWDVPEGWWRVKSEKDGYETAWSDWVAVPPPQTEVHIGMTPVGSTVTYTSASISLAGDIGVNYYAQLSDDIVADEDAYMQFTVAGQTQTVPLEDAVTSTGADGSTTYRFTCKVAAKQMTEEITGQMYLGDGTAVGEEKVYSVKAYCDAAIPVYSQYAAYADLVDLMEAMLNYGGYSQTQFGYNTGSLANAGMDTTLPAITADEVAAYAHGATGSEDGISVASVSLLLESTTTIRFYFKLDGTRSIDAYTFYVDGVETVPVESNGQYYVDKVNVAAKDLDEMVTVTVGGLTARYCGLSYVRQVAVLYPNYYSAALVNVAKALYAYNQAANAYFG